MQHSTLALGPFTIPALLIIISGSLSPAAILSAHPHILQLHTCVVILLPHYVQDKAIVLPGISKSRHFTYAHSDTSRNIFMAGRVWRTGLPCPGRDDSVTTYNLHGDTLVTHRRRPTALGNGTAIMTGLGSGCRSAFDGRPRR